jgi:octaprenyl-diphosphate synthase
MPGPDPHRAAICCRPSWEPVFGPVEEDLARVRRRIADLIQEEEPLLRDRLIGLTDRPGKMIRPAVVLLAAKVCGGIEKEHIELAAIMELVHSATLLHDDVIDQASVRRGSPSANVLWGNTAAVLLGDFLLSRAFALGVNLQIPDVSALLIATAEEICRGELLQNLHRADWELSEAQYMKMIDGKTAALFACSAALGARAAGAEESLAEALTQYGRRLGQAFQIRDDLLDLLGSEQHCGKTLGTDLAECKLTLPLIVWLRGLPADQKQIEINNLSEGNQIPRIAERIRQSHSVQEVRQILESLCGQANRSLAQIPDCAAKEGLLRLAQILSCPL